MQAEGTGGRIYKAKNTCTRVCTGQAGKQAHRGQMSHLYGRLEIRHGECVSTDIERRSEGGRGADVCVALGSLVHI